MARNRSEREWIGGRVSAPMYITEGEPYRPDLILWMELPEGFIVGTSLINPKVPDVSFGDSLVAAMNRPMIGSPRRPTIVRVANATLADEVRAATGPGVTVRVAPTPEIDSVIRTMSETIGDEESEPASYFEGGRVSPSALEVLFGASRLLFEVAPWTVMNDQQLVRVDIPKLGVEGACLSIIGALGDSLGMILFPSLAGFDAFLAASMTADGTAPIDLGTTYLSLNFERGADLPATMRREVAEHGWEVAGPNAYPQVVLRDRDGLSRPLSEKHLRIVGACAASFAGFFLKHRDLFERDSGPPVCESYSDEDDLTVRFTLPYQAHSLFEIEELPPRAAASAPRVGRNAPCPCGSGKKYKKCHLDADAAASRPESSAESVHERDARLIGDVLRWAGNRLDSGWAEVIREVDDEYVVSQLLICWCVYHGTVDGRRVVDRFLEECGRHISPEDREWLESQRRAWLSIWEVAECEPGVGLRLRDLLTGEQRDVREVSGSKTLVKRDAVLGRVVDHGGFSVLCGMYPRALPPPEAAELVDRVRARLRVKRAVSVERLREEDIGRYMVKRWHEAMADLDRRAKIPPKLANTDGEDLLLTTDHFELDLEARKEIESRLASLEGAELDETNGDELRFDFVRPGNARHADWEVTVVGRARLTGGKLTLETNSIARADHLRRLVEGACGALLRHRIREHSDPRAELTRASAADVPPPPEPPEAAALVREYKERHYRRWADEALPALGGRSPRQAMRTAAGRSRVDILLKDMENHESRLAEDERYDFSRLRRKLGLDP